MIYTTYKTSSWFKYISHHSFSVPRDDHNCLQHNVIFDQNLNQGQRTSSLNHYLHIQILDDWTLCSSWSG